MLWQYFGLNVGNDINFGTGANFSQSVIQRDANYLVGLGIPYFRANANANNADAKTYIRYLMKTLHDLGANVQYGIQLNGMTAEQEDTYEGYIAEEATYAASEGFERFQVGNEMEINKDAGYSLSALYTWLQTLPAIVSGVGFTGEITYSVAQDNFTQWTSNGIGNFDDLGADIYGDGTLTEASFASFKSKVASFNSTFGSNGYLSEWAVSQNTTDLYKIDPELYAKWMLDRQKYIESVYTRPSYMHCWRFNGNNNLDIWAAKCDSGELRVFWFDITGQRRLTYL